MPIRRAAYADKDAAGETLGAGSLARARLILPMPGGNYSGLPFKPLVCHGDTDTQ
jgi:hypothetical protein